MMFFRIGVATIDVLLGLAALWLLNVSTRRAPFLRPETWRKRVGGILLGVAGAVMLGSGCLKFAHVPMVMAEMTSLGLGDWRLELVASLEVIGGVLLLAPRLRSIGLAFASAYLGAAICAHVQTAQYFAVLPTMVILGCCWLGAGLRYPHLLWSLAPRHATAGVRPLTLGGPQDSGDQALKL